MPAGEEGGIDAADGAVSQEGPGLKLHGASLVAPVQCCAAAVPQHYVYSVAGLQIPAAALLWFSEAQDLLIWPACVARCAGLGPYHCKEPFVCGRVGTLLQLCGVVTRTEHAVLPFIY